jgi:hypothetical protein
VQKTSESDAISNGNKLRKNVKSQGLKSYKEDGALGAKKPDKDVKKRKQDIMNKTADPLLDGDIKEIKSMPMDTVDP